MNRITMAFVLAALLSAAAPVVGQQSDVTFYVIGKHAKFQQDASAQPTPVDYSFFSEIFLAEGGNVYSGAILTTAAGERVQFRDMREAEDGSRDNILLVSGAERYASFEELQQRYPDGAYFIRFDTPSGGIDARLMFEAGQLPAAPEISVTQGGSGSCRALQPFTDATVRWSAFVEGRADPNGILDDLIFVILTDADGNRVAHSGRPFEAGTYLTYADESYLIDGAVLQSGAEYTLSVEHALLDNTIRMGGVPAFTTRAVTTKLTISTGILGEPPNCAPAPEQLPKPPEKLTVQR